MRNRWGWAAAAVLLLPLACCSVPTAPDPNLSPPTALGTQVSVPPPVSTVPVAGPATTAVRPPTTTRPAVAAPPPLRPCRAADLVAAAGSDDPPADWTTGSASFATRIVLTSHAATDCGLSGWPRLTLYGNGLLQLCTPGAPTPGCPGPENTTEPRSITVTDVTTGNPVPLLVRPGETALFTILYQYSMLAGDESTDGCGSWAFAPPYGGDVYVPGDSAPIPLVPFPGITPCDGLVQLTGFGVSA